MHQTAQFLARTEVQAFTGPVVAIDFAMEAHRDADGLFLRRS